MARGVRQRAKRASDSVRANNSTKRSKFGPRLKTVSQCSVVPNDLVGEAHGKEQTFQPNGPR